MLENTKTGLLQELGITVSADIITGFALLLTHQTSTGAFSPEDYFMAFFVPLLIYFPAVRLIRYAFVFRAYIVLYFMYSFFFIVILFIGADIFKNFTRGKDVSGAIIFITLLVAIAILYSLWLFALRKRGLFKKTVSPARIQILRSFLKPREKLTLVFPDRYIKYLETGDEKYLKG